MRVRTWTLLVYALAVACLPTDVRDEDGWLLTRGMIDAAIASIPVLVIEPQPPKAGEVRLTVSTYGNAGCIRPAETRVRTEDRVVTIQPWDYVAPADWVCGQGLVRVVHETTLQLSPGTWTVLVRGRDASRRTAVHSATLEVVP